ncbi:hypothetical protein [Paenibacillus polymyxa]|nr:hypothetical protein [Paenibacillus polymyxa]
MFIQMWGLGFSEWNLQFRKRMTTNIPGGLAAGDFLAYDNKVELTAGTF